MASHLKILTLIDSFGAGGAQNQLSLLASELKLNNHDVHSFQYFTDDFFSHRLKAVGIQQHEKIKKGKLGLNVIGALSHLYDVEKFDVVLAYMDTPNFYAVAARKVSKHKPAIIISHRMSTNIGDLSRAKRNLLFWTNKQANAVICNSYHERDNWLNFQPHLPIFTIYNGINDPLINGDTSLQVCPSRPSDPTPTLETLLAVGTVTPRKNAEAIIKAMAILYERNQLNFNLLWVGEPKANLKEDIAYYEKLNAMIKNENLENNWIWAGQQNDTLEYYRCASALVHTSLIEGLPNVICEAQIVGVPAFVSAVLDHGQMIDVNETGFCFDPMRIDELANKLFWFFNLSLEQKQQYRDKARESGLRKFLLNRCVEQYESIFSKITAIT